MFGFLALAVAVIALVIASRARNEAKELRALLAQGAMPKPEVSVAPSPVASSEWRAPVPAAQPVPPPPPPQAPQAPHPEPIPPYVPPPQPATYAQPAAAKVAIDWESLVGIKLFSWIAGIALVLAAVFLFKYSVEHGWLRPSIRAAAGFITGIALLVVCELRVARNYKFTANAMLGAGIAILYATLFALYGRWQLWPATAAFGGMILVTAAAVYLSTRRDSVFIALLGLLGGFATPALLSSGENQPIALFSYLLLLNGGISWIAFRKGWPLLTALSVALTAIYQWAWVEEFLTRGQLPLAGAIFCIFAALASALLWQQRGGTEGRQKAFRVIGAIGAVLPLLFAFFTAIVPEYGARYNVLFSFLFLVAAGLAAIALWRGPEWLHSFGGLATLVTWSIWLTVSYTPQSWPWSLVWLAAFVLLYLAVRVKLDTLAVYAAPLLFYVFIGLAMLPPLQQGTLTGAMLALLAIVLAFAWRIGQWRLATTALALSSIAMMAMDKVPATTYLAVQTLLFALMFLVAWISEEHKITVVASVPFFIGAVFAADRYSDGWQFLMAALLYALFLLYPVSLGARVKRTIAPHFAAVLASIVFFTAAYDLGDSVGLTGALGAVPLLQAILMLGLAYLLLRLEPNPARFGIVAMAALAFLTIAVPVQLEDEWIAIAWAIEAAALAWLYARVRHDALLWWVSGLSVAVLFALGIEGRFASYIPTYLICAAAMYVALYYAPPIRLLTSAIGTVELFILLNLAIREYHFGTTVFARDLTYTFGWAVFAIAMLVAGIVFRTRIGRVAALGLLVVTVLKCFLHDLGRLEGLLRVASLFGLAVSLVLVGLVLQKFVIMKRPVSETSPAQSGTT